MNEPDFASRTFSSGAAPEAAPEAAPAVQAAAMPAPQQPVPPVLYLGYAAPAPQQPAALYANAQPPVQPYGAPVYAACPAPSSQPCTRSIVALVFGILGLFFCLTGLGAIVSVLFGAAGFSLALSAKKENDRSAVRTAGIITGAVSFGLGLLIFLVVLVLVAAGIL